jgi:HEAT repeat protein
MCGTTGPFRLAGSLFGLAIVAFCSHAVSAQSALHGFATGGAARAWEQWSSALEAVLDRDEEGTEQRFENLLALDPSPLRLALLSDHTVKRTSLGGAVLLLEQDLESGALGANAERVGELLEVGREQLNQAGDVFYFCQIGRFDVAAANLKALLGANPDPVALLEFTEQVPRRRVILVQLMDSPVVGDLVREYLRLLDEGEVLVKADPTRIRHNVERLGGPPRAFENAVSALEDSGEYAVPFLIEALRDSSRAELTQPILRALPKIDRPALNPLVMALRVPNDVIKRYAIDTLGMIGYRQPLPYLLQITESEEESTEVKQAAAAAISRIHDRHARTPNPSAAAAFYELAGQYYDDQPSLAADPRLDAANVWYWRDDILWNVKVPTAIFNEIMAMRSCEEALRLDPGHAAALSLWLAANFRREAQLPLGEQDPTRPPNYPPASYFAQSAGAEYCLQTLARGLADGDPAVALGAIEALSKTAGPASLVSPEAGRPPLSDALTFPDRMVRIRAGLTLGRARPLTPFEGYQNLMPVLSEALMLHAGARNALVVDPDEPSANALAAALRNQGFEVLIDAGLLSGLQRAREELPGIDVIFVGSNITAPALEPGLAAMRDDFRFAVTPAIIVIKPGDTEAVEQLVRKDHRLEAVAVQPSAGEIARAIASVSRAVGTQAITPEVGAQLAAEAAEVLKGLALTNNPVFDVSDSETALLVTLENPSLALRLSVAEVLGYLGSTRAQEAIARIALDETEAPETRVKMFAALAEAAKRRGNLLGEALVERIVSIAEADEDLAIREAASEALGALNVPGGPASEIIRNQYRG